jgi:hypothetical protein
MHTASRNGAALDADRLAWPAPEDAASDSLEANHYYMPDIRLAGWGDVDAVSERENEVLALLRDAEDCEVEWESQRDRIIADADDLADEFFAALDPGIASATLSLGAVGCIPFWSCNGGAFGGEHQSPTPVVKFFAQPEHIPLLVVAADAANVTLAQDEHGRCAVSADNIDLMRAFALAMRERAG